MAKTKKIARLFLIIALMALLVSGAGAQGATWLARGWYAVIPPIGVGALDVWAGGQVVTVYYYREISAPFLALYSNGRGQYVLYNGQARRQLFWW